MFSNMRRLCISLIILPGLFLSSTSSSVTKADDIRIDVPADGRVHVENRFGDVAVEIWDKPYVSVSAVVTSPSLSSLTRSPIVIDNRGSFLSISTQRIPINSIAAIDLTLKIPKPANIQVRTIKGKIVLRGLSESALLKSISGDIDATLNEPLDVNLTARAPRGVITSSLTSKPAADDRLWQVRLGTGSQRRTLDAQTESGRITFAPPLRQIVSERTEREPALAGANSGRRIAGVPENPNQPAELDEGDVIRVDSQLVTLNMSVIDRGTNRGLMGLRQSDFRLFEDGEEQSILEFESASAPFDLVLLMDLSGSTKEVVKLIRAAALHFVEAARPADRIAIITFAADAKVVSELTVDREVLRQRINTIDTERGDTRVYDSTAFAMNEVTKEAKKSRRTAIILMSDGLDGTIPGVNGQYGSQMSYQEALRTIQEFDGVLYTLCLDTYYQAMNPRDTQPEAFDMGYDRMKEMAEVGGGIFYEVKHLKDLAGAYEQVVADLGTVYSLAYRPSNKARDSKWRAIKITINRSNAVARGKRGYYAN
jgi:VWFA-related protein